jgi:hypothetical protein
VKALYETLIVPHLRHSSKPVWDFDDWYMQLDSWGRGIIHASRLKEDLNGFNYTNWGEISKLNPGIEMDKVTNSIKLDQVVNQEPEDSHTTPEEQVPAT